MYIVFDVETTGLPRRYKAPVTDLKNWPRIVQIAWSCHSEEGEETGSGNHIIYPEGFVIPDSVAQIHGITQKRAEEEGIPISWALASFARAAQSTEYLVAHNIDFDYPIISAELYRCGIPSPLEGKERICTMKTKSVICHCNLRKSNGALKWPKLSELHHTLFEEGFEGAHNAMADVQACARCFFELRRREVL